MALICRTRDVEEGEARGFEVESPGGERIRTIVAKRAGALYVYRNRCPHRGTPLDWMPDRFLDAEGEHLICATHGALFRVEDGHCIAGPCAGDALTPIAFEVIDDEIRLRG